MNEIIAFSTVHSNHNLRWVYCYDRTVFFALEDNAVNTNLPDVAFLGIGSGRAGLDVQQGIAVEHILVGIGELHVGDTEHGIHLGGDILYSEGLGTCTLLGVCVSTPFALSTTMIAESTAVRVR